MILSANKLITPYIIIPSSRWKAIWYYWIDNSIKAKTPGRPSVGFEKLSVFKFLFVCAAIDVSEFIQFTWNMAQMFVLCEISWIVFGAHCQNVAFTGISQNYIVALWTTEGGFLKSVLTWLLFIKINKNYIHYSDAQ